jgi:hypothetical protein
MLDFKIEIVIRKSENDNKSIYNLINDNEMIKNNHYSYVENNISCFLVIFSKKTYSSMEDIIKETYQYVNDISERYTYNFDEFTIYINDLDKEEKELFTFDPFKILNQNTEGWIGFKKFSE